MDTDTWVILIALAISVVGGVTGLYWALRHELKETRTELKGDVDDLKRDIARLDDRVYALAAGLKPHLDSPHGHS